MRIWGRIFPDPGTVRWSLFWLCCAVLGGASLVGAQSSRYTVAVLTPGQTFDPAFQGLRQGLAHAGFEEGKNIAFVIEDTQGGGPDLADRAARLAERKPDVLVTVATNHAAAAKQVTTTVPIVFAVVGDPVGSGLISSYASSKNNVTGVSSYAGPLTGKRLEVIKEVVPGVERVLAMVAIKEPFSLSSFQFLDETAKKLGVQVLRRDVTTGAEIEQVLQGTPAGSVDAIFYLPGVLMGSRLALIIAKAKEDKIPLIVPDASMVEQGALLSYGADFKEMGAQAAKLVVKVLKGTKPAELPIQTPEKLLLTINLTTAKAIGLTIPREVLERADRLVE